MGLYILSFQREVTRAVSKGEMVSEFQDID